MDKKVCIVTGGTSGIGLAAVNELRTKGCIVYSISRRLNPADEYHIPADITNYSQVKDSIDRIIRRENRVDILINCAGFGISGAIEYTEPASVRKQFDVNFFGLTNAVHAVLPFMRKQGCGRIVNISSVAASAPIPFQAYYSASKAAINSYTCSLANELRPYGITVCAIMPGDIATGFTDAREKSIAGDDVYGGRIAKSVAVMEKDERGGMKAESAGKAVAKVALSRKVKPLYSIGFAYKAACLLLKVLPTSFSNWLLYLIYAN